MRNALEQIKEQRDKKAIEIIKEVCKPYGGFPNVITKCGGTLVSQLWIKSMRLYAAWYINKSQTVDENDYLIIQLGVKYTGLHSLQINPIVRRCSASSKNDAIDKFIENTEYIQYDYKLPPECVSIDGLKLT